MLERESLAVKLRDLYVGELAFGKFDSALQVLHVAVEDDGVDVVQRFGDLTEGFRDNERWLDSCGYKFVVEDWKQGK